jgi:hypothetical protein
VLTEEEDGQTLDAIEDGIAQLEAGQGIPPRRASQRTRQTVFKVIVSRRRGKISFEFMITSPWMTARRSAIL